MGWDFAWETSSSILKLLSVYCESTKRASLHCEDKQGDIQVLQSQEPCPGSTCARADKHTCVHTCVHTHTHLHITLNCTKSMFCQVKDNFTWFN